MRLAVLYTLAKTSPQDDQRALQLLENVSQEQPGLAAVKQLAAVLQAQIAERARAVRDEQQKADAAIQKLEALPHDGARACCATASAAAVAAAAEAAAAAAAAGAVVAAGADGG